jgi:hypothetical protein
MHSAAWRYELAVGLTGDYRFRLPDPGKTGCGRLQHVSAVLIKLLAGLAAANGNKARSEAQGRGFIGRY